MHYIVILCINSGDRSYQSVTSRLILILSKFPVLPLCKPTFSPQYQKLKTSNNRNYPITYFTLFFTLIYLLRAFYITKIIILNMLHPKALIFSQRIPFTSFYKLFASLQPTNLTTIYLSTFLFYKKQQLYIIQQSYNCAFLPFLIQIFKFFFSQNQPHTPICSTTCLTQISSFSSDAKFCKCRNPPQS
ncbi:Transmembrane domain-containing protein [Spironucleus salmonicida]|uniref:Transmembrane domain-containing protein n=1 Tax=Spironucleus salmonicida TaxID=348837 RepID=V6LW74_9EUKA|nr:Transmembrane domain-containing protein [Spironucleus salmonicida]|eukprot:EST47961.1 Transmembrane domain-containing protein [Spironucleus salmonicida]